MRMVTSVASVIVQSNPGGKIAPASSLSQKLSSPAPLRAFAQAVSRTLQLGTIWIDKKSQFIWVSLVRCLQWTKGSMEKTNRIRLRVLIGANVFLQFADGFVTILGTSRGFAEGNPLVAAAMTSIGPTGGILFMKLLALGFLYIIYRRGDHPMVIPGLGSIALAYIFLAVLPWTLLLAGSPPG